MLFFYYSFFLSSSLFYFFFFNDTATTEIYTLSLHDALPISRSRARPWPRGPEGHAPGSRDRKSTRLNSSHSQISYAVFCLKKKKKKLSLLDSRILCGNKSYNVYIDNG